jgi:hypothetical protein
MNAICGSMKGAIALVVLGGPSGESWQNVKGKTGASLIICVNGVNSKIENPDYWICTENMNRAARMAKKGAERYADIMRMYQKTGPKIRLVNWKSYDLLTDKKNVIRIKRDGVEDTNNPGAFSVLNYGDGLMTGSLYDRKDLCSAVLRTGTVGLQALHLAALLGAKDIHTVGYDLSFPNDGHHWYNYPTYEADEYWSENAFVEYNGVKTLDWWVKTAEYLRGVEKLLLDAGVKWADHSNGLLQMMGIANG